MAVWFTKERSQPGPIFGNKDQFTGLGVILDTFDNDNKVRLYAYEALRSVLIEI
jgi:hypothetical protein